MGNHPRPIRTPFYGPNRFQQMVTHLSQLDQQESVAKIKPRVRPVGAQWDCHHNGLHSYGRTIEEAYTRWRKFWVSMNVVRNP